MLKKIITLLTLSTILFSYAQQDFFIDLEGIARAEQKNYGEIISNIEYANIQTTSLNISAKGNAPFPDKIYNLTNLQALYLGRYLQNTDNPFPDLNEGINKLNKLKYLHISDLGIGQIPFTMMLPELNYFLLSTRYVEMYEFPNLSGMLNISCFYLELKNGSDISKSDNLKSLSKLNKLEYLGLENCKLNDSNSAVLTNLSNLKKLNIWGNEISDLAPYLTSVDLYVLDAGNNKITQLPTSFNSKKLISIILRNNPIAVLSSQFFELQSLKSLDLSYCQLSSISSKINTNSSIEYLNLMGNSSLSQIPSELFRLNNLKELDLRDCKIQTIPNDIINSSITNLKLSVVNHEENNFDLEQLAQIKSLKSLSISGLGNSFSKVKKRFAKLRPDVSFSS